MKNVLLVIIVAGLLAACSPKPPETPAETVMATPPAVEFADARYTEIGKQGIDLLSKGDVDTWVNSFADSARYYWSGGDSVIGKPAILAYWKERRGNVIDSITFTNDVWIPIKINEPQRGPDRKGVWLLSWYFANVKYKNGKKIGMWIHTDFHFDDNNKIDQVVQYLDRVPINAALAKK